jgi:DNA-binding beta-propeller fold protein YncE
MRTIVFGIATWLGTALAVLAASWTVSEKIPVRGDGGWDYVTLQPEEQRLYVTHQDRIAVLDLTSKKEVGSIPGDQVHGVALAPEFNRGFVSNGGNGTVTVFDLKTLQPITTLPAAPDADAICYEPVSKRILTFNGDSGNSTVIDAAAAKVVATLPLDGKPEFATADGKGAVYVNIEDKDQIVKIDAASPRIVARWGLPPGSKPSSLAMDQKGRRLFVGCRNKTLLVVDADGGKVVATLPIGAGVDATVYDPQAREVFSSCGDGTISVIEAKDRDTYAVKETISTVPRARTMALDPATRSLYLPSAQFGTAPAPTADNPHPRPPLIRGTFQILVLRQTPSP